MNFTYDFSFVELAIKFLETGDTEYLRKISELEAADHIFNHAVRYTCNVPKGSKLELVSHLLTPIYECRKELPQVIRNLDFAKEHILKTRKAEKIVLQYLPKDFIFSSSFFFTFGYDIGVAYGNNCSLNLAHPHFSGNMNEMIYYAIHEMHHAGFITLQNGYMPSLEMSVRKDVAHLIEDATHLEGMGTYAPLSIREQEDTMDNDRDYIALQNQRLMDDLIKEYFDIYYYFKDNPDEC